MEVRAPYETETAGRVRAEITGIDIPFRDLVLFFIKAALASIPAAIVVGIVYVVAFGIVAAIVSSFGPFGVFGAHGPPR